MGEKQFFFGRFFIFRDLEQFFSLISLYFSNLLVVEHPQLLELPDDVAPVVGQVGRQVVEQGQADDVWERHVELVYGTDFLDLIV